MCLFPTKQGFPCGKCAECLSRQRNDWSIRLQFQVADTPPGCSNYFFTLTYDREHVPWVWCFRAGNQYFYAKSLCKYDVQRFMKVLRIRIARGYDNNARLKYFCGAEYGPRTMRPHYHMILFNVPIQNIDELEALLQEIWFHGEVRRVRSLIPARCHYATKYMIAQEFLPSDFSVRPFRLMSNGLGKILFENVDSSEFKNRFYAGLDPEEVFLQAHEVFMFCKTQNFYFCENPHEIVDQNYRFPWDCYDAVVSACRDFIILNGKKYQIPRYVRDKVFPDEVRFVLNLQKRILVAQREYDYYLKYGAYDEEQRFNHLPTMKQQINKQKFDRMKTFYDKRYKKKLDKRKNIC